MRLYEIITEREMRILPDGTYEYFTPGELTKHLNSDYPPFRAGAEAFIKKNPPRGEFWPKDWNANALAVVKSRQDQHNTELKMPPPEPQEKPEYVVKRDINKLSRADLDLGRPDDEISAIAGAGTDVEPKPTMPMGGIAGVIRRKKQK
ncbi:MAG: hypothetical protein CXT73_00780 [Methanobacteriota archaeon]|jgi:hypothetical protein|nr:MAG: hypothetical protein CXT73_00780 [Euryarchaeota archaeon]